MNCVMSYSQVYGYSLYELCYVLFTGIWLLTSMNCVMSYSQVYGYSLYELCYVLFTSIW